MATFEGVWIRTGIEPGQLARELSRLGRTHAELREIRELATGEGSAWKLAIVRLDIIAATAGVISRELSCMCIGLAMQSVVDAFAFWHFQDGVETRRLVYGVEDERVWGDASGTPAPWEEDLLWSRQKLDRVLEFAPESEHDLIRETIRNRTIHVGSDIPSLDARSLALDVLQHYGIPTIWPDKTNVGPPWPLRAWRLFW